MKQYLDLLREVRTQGHEKGDRTGTGTLSIFGTQMRFNLQKGFPLVTTKKCHLRSIIHELLWFLQGDTNTKYLTDNKVTIWNEWQDEDGNLGPVYGKQWREWSDVKVAGAWDTHTNDILLKRGYRRVGVIDDDNPRMSKAVFQKEHDQISTVMNQLRNDPDSRRIIVSAWNVGDLADMALQPCHSFFQFYTRKLSAEERINHLRSEMSEAWKKWNPSSGGVCPGDDVLHDKLDDIDVPVRALSCHLYMRSQDIFLGTPFNIASYALLTEMMAQQLNMVPGDFILSGGDVHLYSNHMEQAELQLSREPLPLPKLKFKRKPDSIFDYKFEDIELVGYVSHDPIKAPVAI